MLNFDILTKDIPGKGVNISQGGFGFFTEKKIETDKIIPFETQIHGFVFSDKNYSIKGKARLIYSIKTESYRDLFYNGFKFTELDDQSKENLYQLLEDIKIFKRILNPILKQNL